MGLKYNNTKISQKATDAQYPYYNGTQVAQVYYNGTLVWKKYTILPYTFSGGTVTKYNGAESSVTIPSQYYTLTDIDGTVVYTSTAIGTATSVTAIGANAFENNSSITSVTIPSTIKTIGNYAFKGCYNLATVTMSATPTSIGTQAFAVTKITSLSSYMYNCTSLGSGCFASRSGWHLKSPNNSTGLGGDAILNRLLATNTGGTISANGYTGAGAVYIIRSRFNVHQSGGTLGTSGGSFSCTATLAYSRTSFTSLSTSVGVGGSSSGYEYCIASTSVPTASISVSMNSTPSNYSSWSGGQTANFTPSAGGTDDHDIYATVAATCLVKGTLITLADGTQKPIEDLTYKDLLLVWNFETGTYDYQYPLTITTSYTKYITRIFIDDGTHIDISGLHDLYDPILHKFVQWGEGIVTDEDIKTKGYHVFKRLNKNSYAIRKVIDAQIIEKDIQVYGLITGGTITAFANDFMVGNCLLNYARINSQHLFEKEFQKDKALCYTYDRFKKEVSPLGNKYTVLGMCMHYAPIYFNYVPGIEKFIRPHINNLISIPSKNNKYICTIGILDGYTLIESEHLEDEEITLPEITSELKTHWYVVGEYKLLKPGDKYKINFSTLIRAV